MNGVIGFEELTLETTIGAFPEERKAKTLVFVDVRLEVSLARAIATDDLAATIDYGEVIDFIQKSYAERTFFLIEALAGSLCEELLAAFPVTSVAIRVKKPLRSFPVKWAICEHKVERKR